MVLYRKSGKTFLVYIETVCLMQENKKQVNSSETEHYLNYFHENLILTLSL